MNKLFTRAALFACLLALTGALAGCAPQPAIDETDEAALNRQYMAMLNRQMADVQTELEEFQTAVAEGDLVTMRAKLGRVDKIVEAVAESEPTERLADVKDGYADALAGLSGALADYADLYAQWQAGDMTDAAFQSQASRIQAAYDAGIEALQQADAAVEDIANE